MSKKTTQGTKGPKRYSVYLKNVQGSATFTGTPSKKLLDAVNKMAELAYTQIKKTKIMNTIPTQLENTKGLHQRYQIRKIVVAEQHNDQKSLYGKHRTNDPYLKTVNTDKDSEYFVMRLDEGGSDIEHIKACRIGVHAYADAIEHHLPELSKDLRERYPLL